MPAHLATPRWTTDAHFDVTWHLRRVGAPAPHGRDEVLALAALAAMSGFDHTRPLWEFTLVEGLEHGGAAIIMKMHHSLTDGIGGVQLALALFDTEADHTVSGPLPSAPPGEQVGGRRLVVQVLADRAARLRDGFLRAARLAPGATARVVRHPLGTGGGRGGDGPLHRTHGAPLPDGAVAGHDRARARDGSCTRSRWVSTSSSRRAPPPAGRSTTASWPASPAACAATTSATARPSTS